MNTSQQERERIIRLTVLEEAKRLGISEQAMIDRIERMNATWEYSGGWKAAKERADYWDTHFAK